MASDTWNRDTIDEGNDEHKRNSSDYNSDLDSEMTTRRGESQIQWQDDMTTNNDMTRSHIKKVTYVLIRNFLLRYNLGCNRGHR